MARQKLTIQRLIFLFVLAVVFIFTYVADFNLFSVIISALALAAPKVRLFAALFLALSFAGLSLYYILSKSLKGPAADRYLAWIKVFSWSFFMGFLLSSLVIYMNIYANKTFDIN